MTGALREREREGSKKEGEGDGLLLAKAGREVTAASWSGPLSTTTLAQ